PRLEPSSSLPATQHRPGSVVELQGYSRSTARACLRRGTPELDKTCAPRTTWLVSIAAAMANAEETRKRGRCADHQTSPVLAESTSSAPPSTGSSKRSVRRPDGGGLRSAAGCCGSAHHRESKRADVGDAPSRSPAAGRHRWDHPWLRWDKTPSGTGTASAG